MTLSPALLVTLSSLRTCRSFSIGLLLLRQHPEWDEEAVHNDEHQVRVQ